MPMAKQLLHLPITKLLYVQRGSYLRPKQLHVDYCNEMRAKKLQCKTIKIGKWINNYCTYQSQSCYMYKEEATCAQNSCTWTTVTRCEQKSCNAKQSQSSCESSSGCKWMETYCIEEESCGQFTSQSWCEGAKNLDCEWLNNFCSPIQQYCYNYRTQNSCEKSNCEWLTTGQCGAQYNPVPQVSCYEFSDAGSCGSAKGCIWNENSNYCEVLRP